MAALPYQIDYGVNSTCTCLTPVGGWFEQITIPPQYTDDPAAPPQLPDKPLLFVPKTEDILRAHGAHGGRKQRRRGVTRV